MNAVFRSYLNTQKESIMSALPSGFNLAGALGLSSIANIGTTMTGAMPDTAHTAAQCEKKTQNQLGRTINSITCCTGTGMVFLEFEQKISEDSTVAQLQQSLAE